MADPRPDDVNSTIMSNEDLYFPPQNIDTTVALTQGQLSRLKARIKKELARLRAPKDKTPFHKATDWVLAAFSYDVHLGSEFVPPPTYGVRFQDFVNYIHRKEADARAEQVLEDIDPEAG